MKKIGFFVTLPASTVATIAKRRRETGVPKWRVVDAAIRGHTLIAIGGPRRKARGRW